jgi:hypothetical protein
MVKEEAKRENIVMAAQPAANNSVVKPFTEETLSKKIVDTFKSQVP